MTRVLSLRRPGAQLPSIVDRIEARARALDAHRSARTRHSVERLVAGAGPAA